MAVNDELGEIRTLLASAGSLLKPGGRLVMISFHSLEDRLVKDAFKEWGTREEVCGVDQKAGHCSGAGACCETRGHEARS